MMLLQMSAGRAQARWQIDMARSGFSGSTSTKQISQVYGVSIPVIVERPAEPAQYPWIGRI